VSALQAAHGAQLNAAELPYLVLSAILPFISTALGGLTALRIRHRLHPVMALAAGVLVATALVNLLPEARELLGESGGPLMLGGAAIAGFLAFSSLEALVHQRTWEHQHPPEELAHEPHPHPADEPGSGALGWAGPAGLIVHSTLDGVAIGLGFSVSLDLGLIVVLAVVAHDFADGLNVVTLALVGGRDRQFALTVLVLDALAPPLGVVIGTVIPLSHAVLGVLLAVFAGVFLAIGAGHLLPEAQHQRPGNAPPLVFLAGVGAVFVLALRTVLVG
jgi:ZIP family zinc transporter